MRIVSIFSKLLRTVGLLAVRLDHTPCWPIDLARPSQTNRSQEVGGKVGGAGRPAKTESEREADYNPAVEQ